MRQEMLLTWAERRGHRVVFMGVLSACCTGQYRKLHLAAQTIFRYNIIINASFLAVREDLRRNADEVPVLSCGDGERLSQKQPYDTLGE